MKMPEQLWRPAASRVEKSRLREFTDYVANGNNVSFRDYGELHHWSVENLADFWSAVWNFADIRSSEDAQVVLRNPGQFPGARWFEGARLNYAENLLAGRDAGTAIVSHLENGERKEISWQSLRDDVARTAAALRLTGVEQGDRVAGLLPNVPETIVAMLATASIGAVWSSCSPDFGVNGVLDRFGQLNPKVLIACDGYYYSGKTIDCRENVEQLKQKMPSLQATVMVELLQDTNTPTGVQTWSDYLGFDDGRTAVPPLQFAQLPFDHPLFIMFSSGTTGVPKCIVHSAGGTLIQHVKEHQLHVGLQANDVLFYFTTCGWMMWNWTVSALASGVTLVLYDGSPFHPEPDVLFDLVDSEGINVLGVGAKFISSIENAGLNPSQTHSLATLRTVLSTGSPLSNESFRYVYREVKSDVCLSSICGGTDIISCFALGNECLPVVEGELQCMGLGMAVEIWDDHGKSIRETVGELVCTRPFPSTPLGFWDDPEGTRFFNAYFNKFSGIWAQGDFAEVTPNGGLIVHGRSDSVLNPGGVRIGTAEIYRQVESLEDVIESICVGQDWENDVRVILFVVLRQGLTLDEQLTTSIRQRIRRETTPRHVPAKIIQIFDIPKTRSGKIAEVAVRDVINGRPVDNLTSLTNPEALDEYRDLDLLRS